MGVLPTATALTQREAAYLAAAQANGRRAEAAEARIADLENANGILIEERGAAETLNTRYREALERVKEAAKADDRDQVVRLVDEALSSPADSQEQDG